VSPATPTPALDLDLLAPEVVLAGGGRVRVLPVVHERVEIAAVVRSALEALDPAAVAVELPTPLREAVLAGVRRLPLITLLVTQEADEEALVWTIAPGDPFAEALRWALEHGKAVACVDPDLPYEGRHRDPVPDPHAAHQMGGAAYLALLREAAPAASEEDELRERGMAHHLRVLAEETAAPETAQERGGVVLAVVGAAHAKRLAIALARPTAHPFARVRRTSIELCHLHPRDLTALLPDPPLAHAVWERLRDGDPIARGQLEEVLSRKVSLVRYGLRVIAGEGGEGEARRKRRLVEYAAGEAAVVGARGAPDRRALARLVWRVGAGSYREQTGEELSAAQQRLFFDYSERCARLQGQLAPGLYEWTVAARGVADDNLAWEVFDAASTYPWQGESAELPTVRIDGSELDLGTRKVRFRRRFLRVKSRPLAVPVRERPRPADPEDWLRGFDGSGLCSYPPEDLVIEDYGRFLQKKAVGILSAESRRSEPFSSSLLDGIDVRETLRRVHEDRVWVEELGRAPGAAGSVVVVFDRDRERHPFAMTWHGENDQESDMAFYATDPAEQVVGPGILRATYGGFLLTLPRGRLFDVWSDPDYRFARDPGEVLTLAAVDYSLEPIVVHVAAQPPSEAAKRFAAAQKKRIVHVPLGSLSPTALKRIRVMHILSGREKRQLARDYIW
jgi:hypothetical protein